MIRLQGKLFFGLIFFSFVTLIFMFAFAGNSFASSGANGAVTWTNKPSTPQNPGTSFGANVEVCNTTSSNQFINITPGASRGSVTPSGSGQLVSPFACVNMSFTVNAPTAQTGGSCSSLTQSFDVWFDSAGGFGSDAGTVILLAQVGLTVNNSTSSTINVTVQSTSFGQSAGDFFTVSPGGANGPGRVWYVNCAQYPTVGFTISVTGGTTGTFSNSASNQNGCHFQVYITVTGGGGGSAPGPFSISVFFECSGTSPGIRITGGPASNATGYKIYWTSSGDPIPGGLITTVGSLPYSNYSFSPGGNFLNVDVAATNATGDTQSTNGWMSGQVPTTTACGGGGGGTNDFTLYANGSTGPVSISSGGSVQMTWTHTAGSAARTGCSASPNYNSDWGSSNPSSASLSANGAGHGVFNMTSSVVLTVSCSYASGTPNPVQKSVQVNVSGGGGANACSSSPSTVNVNQNTTISGSGGSGLPYSFSYPGGTLVSSTSTSVTIYYTTSGTKTVSVTTPSNPTPGSCTVTVSGGGGGSSCSWSPAGPINVNNSSTVTYNMGAATLRGLTPTTGWTQTGSTANSVTYNFTIANTYTYSLRDGSGNLLASCNITVSGGGGGGSCISSPSVVNTNQTVTYSSSTGSFNNVTTGYPQPGWVWQSTGGASPNFTSLSGYYTSSGVKSFTMNLNPSGTATCTVTVNVPAAPTCVVNPLTAATNQNVSFTLSDGSTISGYFSIPADTVIVQGAPTTNFIARFTATGAKSLSLAPASGGSVTCNVTIANPPGNPTNLIITSNTCNGATPQISFSWTAGANNANYFLDVNGAPWTGDNTPSPWGVTPNLTTTSFTWNSSSVLSGTPSAPANSTTYYWRVIARDSAGTYSAHVYPTSTLTPPGTSFTTSNCAVAGPPTPVVDQITCSINPTLNNSYGYFRVTYAGGASYFVQIYTAASGGSLVMQTNSSSNYSGNLFPGGIMSAGTLSTNTNYYVGLSTTSSGASGGRALVNVPSCTPPSGLTANPACPAGGGAPTVTFSWTNGTAPSQYINIYNLSSQWAANKSINPPNSPVTTAPFDNVAGGATFTNWTPGTSYQWNIWSGGGNFTTGPQINVPSCGPTGLSVSLPACAPAAGYNNLVSFTWSGVSAGWYINLDTNQDWDNNNDGIADADNNKQISGTQSDGTGFSGGFTFQGDVTYRWNIWYGNGDNYTVPLSVNVTGAQLISGGFAPGAGYSFTVPKCLDLSVSFSPLVGPTVQANTPQTVNVVVSNAAGSVISPATTVGIWKSLPGQTPEGNYPNPNSCLPGGSPPNDATSIPPSQTFNVSAGIAAGGSAPFSFTFNTGPNEGPGYLDAYVIPSCSPSDSVWGNNGTRIGSSHGYTFQNKVDAWFQTMGGDVGAKTGITASIAPPTVPVAKYQSDFLIISNVVNANVKSGKWQISSYSTQLPLMPAGIYNYLSERFKGKVPVGNQSKCTFADIAAMPNFDPANPLNSLALCNGNVTIGGAVLPAGKNIAWFVNGDLTISGDVTADVSSSIVYIVSGNVRVQTAVSRVDGIIAARGDFNDVTNSADPLTFLGKQLVVKGSVYTEGNVVLERKLASSNCTATGEPLISPCDNNQFPAESFQFNPKYLVNLNGLIATPSVNWSEVAP